MEKPWRVEFRNVGRTYFPQSRVECHYSLSTEHRWASSDWIGLFKAGWSSLRDYHTFVWALAPVDYIEGTNVNCCVHFQASYLPRPGPGEYQFVYVDGKGQVCSRSSQFVFSAPKPLDDLVTLEQERDGEEEVEDILLVIPRAELLQNGQSSLEAMTKERESLLAERAQSQQRIRELEDEIKTLMQRGQEKGGELEKMKERVKKMSMQMRDEDEERKNLQLDSEVALGELRGLRERLDASERAVEGLRAELSDMATQRDHGQAELHQARLQAAQLTLQLADAGLALREGRASWAQDREALRSSS
ncbi:hypothetical protein JZ751_018093, partial [Albula glossodonta]